MLRAEVQYLVKASGRPIYYASSAGRDAHYTIDHGVENHSVEIHDARGRSDIDDKDEFGQHPSGFGLVRHDSNVSNFLDNDRPNDR